MATTQAAPEAPSRTRAYSISEAAEILTVHKATVWRRIKDGTYRSVKVSAGRVVITADELDRILSGRSTEAA
jgi:excisionase family DNA binding protein